MRTKDEKLDATGLFPKLSIILIDALDLFESVLACKSHVSRTWVMIGDFE